VGYTGGTKDNPTYYALGDHTETVQIDYDPAKISYGELLDIFWSSHNPTARSWSQQYKAAIFYHDEKQEKLAMETRAREEKVKGRIYTEILPATEFYLAEDYHQKYYLQNVPPLAVEFNAIYPDGEDFINSTAVARVNGYLGGYGSLAQLEEELSSLGLSPASEKRLLELVSR